MAAQQSSMPLGLRATTALLCGQGGGEQGHNGAPGSSAPMRARWRFSRRNGRRRRFHARRGAARRNDGSAAQGRASAARSRPGRATHGEASGGGAPGQEQVGLRGGRRIVNKCTNLKYWKIAKLASSGRWTGNCGLFGTLGSNKPS